MKLPFEQGIIEIPTEINNLNIEQSIDLINSFNSAFSEMKIIGNIKDADTHHPKCTHSSPYCGTKYHTNSGHGWCYYCSICNP